MAQSTNTNVYLAGGTFAIAATTTSAQTYVTSGSNNLQAVLVENLDLNNDVFINWGTGSTVTATVPYAGAPQSGITIQNGQGKIINLGTQGTFINNVTIAANCVSGTANVHITPVF